MKPLGQQPPEKLGVGGWRKAIKTRRIAASVIARVRFPLAAAFEPLNVLVLLVDGFSISATTRAYVNGFPPRVKKRRRHNLAQIRYRCFYE